MAVLKPFLQSPKPCGIPSLFISKSQISTIITPKTSSVSVSVATSDRYPSLKRSCSTRNSTPSTESDTSSTGVFIKGLPDSTTEGRLKKAFSQFGEVVQVKIVVEKKFKQPLGSAFVWFTNKESAQLAVKEMNGEIAEPGLSKRKGRLTPYKF
ncbi:organelle RRM domain-containing protein 1, chloroplastic-like isoform X2 [Mangifera indica]|uniref:organelle RRM domain-containing protein 1, chloroplastic-like isoform X2 n=1 Tax=Mangifera indica TaxID=29780 RepID=UPI001CF9947E|nr:organelle RRM domain-containing protein 1, chloroplastic-like isoform X2 [Mangifera indica]